MTISGPAGGPEDVVSLRPDQCLWYRPDEQTARVVITDQKVHHASQTVLDGLEVARLALVIDLPCRPGDSSAILSDITPDNFRGCDLTSSRMGYLLGESGSVDWHLEAGDLVSGSFQCTCLGYPPRFGPEHRLAERYVLTGRFTATRAAAAGPLARGVLWSLERGE